MPDAEALRALAEAREPRLQLVEPFFLLPGSGVTEVLLIRHAQVPEAATTEDDPLTETGREQAQALTTFLAPTQIDAIYASPAQRARETAEALTKGRGLEVVVIEALRDVDNHVPRGTSFREALTQRCGEAEAAERWTRLTQRLKFDAFGDLMETSTALRRRVTDAIDALIEKHAGGRIAVVSHGPPIAAYVSQVAGSEEDFIYYPRLTSITSVLARGEARQIQALNAMPHFGVL
jgi:probable phosphoglycerate mutase